MNRIKELRQENNLTLRQLGEELNLKNSTLSQYETGKRNPKDEIWQKIADFFQVPVPYLRGESSPNKIKNIRQVKGLSQQDVAKALGLTRQAIALYETGQREPKIETWQKLANYFGVSVPSLMGLNEENISRIYTFKGNNSGGYRFVVLANSAKEAWELIKDRIDMNRNTYGYDNKFVRDIRNYSISSIDLNDAAPQVIEDWR